MLAATHSLPGDVTLWHVARGMGDNTSGRAHPGVLPGASSRVFVLHGTDL